jgi:elongator complex protein 3
MLFALIKTEEDIEKLKKQVAKDPVLLDELKRLRTAFQYNKSGNSRILEKKNTVTMPTNAEMLALYRLRLERGEEERSPLAELALRKIKTKSNSGVAVVSVLTKPFPCPGRCTYCPTEERMPKSYLSKEPAAARALANDFDPYLQITNRLKALHMNGHPTDKIELIVIGGTWSFYHPAYQEEFLIGCYRACNDFGKENVSDGSLLLRSGAPSSRHRTLSTAPSPSSPGLAFGTPATPIRTAEERLLELERLQNENEQAQCRMIGLSIETRPDYITDYELVRLRKLGVTKVEIGVQHLDDDVLKLTKRDMKIARVKNATEKLRNAGFKIVYHMMPNLPGSTPERDIEMFRELFVGKDFQPDMLKVYPCVVLENSELHETWKQGGFTTYTDDVLLDVLAKAYAYIPPYVRVLRMIRDIPATYIKAGSRISNLREEVEKLMRKNNTPAQDIRAREIREGSANLEDVEEVSRSYETESGKEIFLSWETKDKKNIISFTRLRLPNKDIVPIIPVLKDAAFIRELHTYGRHIAVGKEGTQSQHRGYGRKLIEKSETIAREQGYKKLVVISGIGVRDYYRKLGFKLEDTYMVKYL